MAPRWGWGRKLIGTDAKTSSEIAKHPQNHLPPAFESCHRAASPPGLNPPSPGLVAAPSLPQALPAEPAAPCLPQADGPERGLPARLSVPNAHVVPRRPPALPNRAAPHPCRASRRVFGLCCREWVGPSPLRGSAPLQEQLPGRVGQGAGLAAGRCLHSSDLIRSPCYSSVAVHPSGTTPMQDRSFGSPGGGPAADITTKPPECLWSLSLCTFAFLSLVVPLPLTLNKGAAAQISTPSCLALAPGTSSESPGTREWEKLSH